MKRSSVILVVLLAAYILGAVYLLPLVRGQINPDGIAYISLAERYLAGDFAGALNGHWGPMFSWLLTPLLAFGLEPLLASKVQTFATGLATLGGVWLLSRRYTQLLVVRTAVCAVLVPMLLTWASAAVTPDLLVVCFLTYYAYFISDPLPSRRSTVLAAIFGALTYYAKSYGFVVFLLHFILVGLVRWRRAEREARWPVIYCFSLGLAIFCALSLPWAAALSVKYHRVTFGTAAAYNFGLVGPANGPVGSQLHPTLHRGLFAPHDERAVSVWEDPTYLHFPPWPSLGPSARHIATLVSANAVLVFDVLEDASPFAWPILAAAFIVSFWRPARGAESRLLLATLAGGAIYAAGYLPLLVEARYLWILQVLLLMLVARLVDFIARRFQLRTVTTGLVVAAIAGSFVARSMMSMPLPSSTERASVQIAHALASNGIDLNGKRLASDPHWAGSLYLAYFVHARYFGAVPLEDPVEIRRQLDEHHIEAFLMWGTPPVRPPYLEGFREVPVTAPDLRFALYEREL